MIPRLRVGITQRRDLIEERHEWRDALDVRLLQIVWEAGFTPIPLASGIRDAEGYLDALDLDAFVLSGGGEAGLPEQRAVLERAVLRRSKDERIPVLGICRGMQVILVACGATLNPVEGHVATRHRITGALTDGREVNSFHALGLQQEDLPDSLTPLAIAQDGTAEAVQHKQHPWTAVMWHPEREDPSVKADVILIKEALQPRSEE